MERKIERKIFNFKIKELNEEGSFKGYLSTFGNVDEGGDIVEKGAFKKTLQEQKAFPLLWAHSASDPSLIIGTFSGQEDEKGLLINGEFFKELDHAQKVYQIAKNLFEKGVKIGLSMGFQTIKFINDTVGGKAVRRLKEVKLLEGSLTLFPMNTLAKIEELKDKGKWTVEYINSLPDEAFAVIEPAYLKGDTEDKRARHLPHHDRSVTSKDDDDSVDLPHLRNALARVNQIIPITNSISASELRQKARTHLIGHAKRLGVGDYDELEGIETKPMVNFYSCRLEDPKKYKRFTQGKREHDGKEYRVIFGWIDGKSEEQAYRYDKAIWGEEEARKHCEEHNGEFQKELETIEIRYDFFDEILQSLEPLDKSIQVEKSSIKEEPSIYSILDKISEEIKKF